MSCFNGTFNTERSHFQTMIGGIIRKCSVKITKAYLISLNFSIGGSTDKNMASHLLS